MTHYRLALWILLLALLASCSTPTPVSTPTSLPTETAVPPTSTPVPTATATSIPVPARAQYTMNVVLDYAAKSVAVDETIVYPNHSGHVLTDLMLAVEPNLWPNCFTLKSLDLNGTAVTNYTLDGQKLSFALPEVFQPEMTATIKLSYNIILPEIEPTNPNLTRPRIFGFSPNQINLTNWYPFVVPNISGQWVLHDPWYYGEHLAYDAADFNVKLKFADSTHIPVVASSGELEGTDTDGVETYILASGRAFIFSISPNYQVANTKVGNVTLYSYYFPSFDKPGKLSLMTSAQALQIYSQRYGPYPHKTLSVIMGDFPDGMEFSASYFTSFGYYNLYAGNPDNSVFKLSVIYLAAHETAHQWWFEQVADDQALQPWLDEAMATYSEHIFFETYYPDQLSLWWYVRSDQYQPQGWVDTPIYSGGGFRTYTNAVYFRGAHFLDDLRKRMGDQAFFAFLQDYLVKENGKIAASADFFHILSQHTTTDYSDLVRQYFQNSY